MIDITGVDLVEFAKAVYELSQAQGMGVLHFTAGPLSQEEAEEIVERGKTDASCPLSMDYVRGRACKMHVRRDEGGKLSIGDSWYDHTDAQYEALLRRFTTDRTPVNGEHGCSCNCIDCQRKQAAAL